MSIVVRTIEKSEFGCARDIRIRVFCDEQGYSQESEFDEYDADATHFVAFDGDKYVATARLINSGNGEFKIGRVAVLKEYRGRGVGKILAASMIDYCKSLGANTIVLDSQVRAMGFYRTLGFVPFGEEHPDGHVPHMYMRLDLSR